MVDKDNYFILPKLVQFLRKLLTLTLIKIDDLVKQSTWNVIGIQT